MEPGVSNTSKGWVVSRKEHTEHVSVLVLAGLLVGNVALDAEPDHGGVLDGVLGNVEAANDAEATTVVEITGNDLELGAKGGQREVGRANIVAVELKSYSGSQHCECPKMAVRFAIGATGNVQCFGQGWGRNEGKAKKELEKLTLEVAQGGLGLDNVIAAQAVDVALIVLELLASPGKLSVEGGRETSRKGGVTLDDVRLLGTQGGGSNHALGANDGPGHVGRHRVRCEVWMFGQSTRKMAQEAHVRNKRLAPKRCVMIALGDSPSWFRCWKRMLKG